MEQGSRGLSQILLNVWLPGGSRARQCTACLQYHSFGGGRAISGGIWEMLGGSLECIGHCSALVVCKITISGVSEQHLGGSRTCVRHCKNTCCLQYRAKLLPLAGPPSPPMMDARGVRRQERGKYLSQMTLDKQKALNSVGHSCTICQGMLRRKADRRGEERSVELTNLQISGDFQPTDPPTPTLLHCLLKLSCIPPISCW